MGGNRTKQTVPEGNKINPGFSLKRKSVNNLCQAFLSCGLASVIPKATTAIEILK